MFCSLFWIILSITENYESMERALVCGPGHVGSDPGCATHSRDVETLVSLSVPPLSVKWRWQHLTYQPTRLRSGKWNETHRPLLLSLFAATMSIFVLRSASPRPPKCGPTFCYGIFGHVLIYRFWFAHSFLRPELEVLPQELLFQYCLPPHMTTFCWWSQTQ